MSAVESYPLTWPATWPRTKWREQSRFKVSLATARDELLRELDLMGASNVVISSNAVMRRDGLPAAKQPKTDDPAVAVYFTLDGDERCIPCDRWDQIEDNIRAIGLTVAALRGLTRWGAGEMVQAAFRGFAALPAPSGVGWWTVLEVRRDASAGEIDAAYRRLAKVHHPDAGGDAERFRVLTEAYRQAGQEWSGEA